MSIVKTKCWINFVASKGKQVNIKYVLRYPTETMLSMINVLLMNVNCSPWFPIPVGMQININIIIVVVDALEYLNYAPREATKRKHLLKFS